ncbi:MAG TPA: DUF4082 domain-containing protein [Candidatus Saccharimonadales bacterium]|nr:DUF4082 domain-containing protein [Candidatus Saccharimonadales bacterium]
MSRTQQNEVASQTAADFDNQEIALAEIDQAGAISVDGKALSVNGQLRANGSLIMAPAAKPTVPTTGQIYYDQTSNHLSYYNGTEFVQLQTNQDASGTTAGGAGGTTVNNITNLSVVNNNIISADNPAGGTTGKIAKFTSGQTLGDSILTDDGTFLTIDGGINITAASSTSDLSLWPENPTPTSFDTTEVATLELGVKFQVDVPGTVKSIRFYKATTENTVNIPVSLWTTGGTLVGQTTVTASGSGWKTATFASPLPVSPDTTYVASYHINSVGGQPVGYPYAAQYFSSSGVDNGPLHGLASGLDGGNGVYRYTATPAVPNLSFNSTNYWVDVVFSGSQFTTDSRIRINDAQISSSDLANDNNLAKRGSSQVFSGHNIFRNASDSVDVFSIQKANTNQLLTVDSTNERIYIGSVGAASSVLLVLANRTATGDGPNPTDGAMYYHAVDGVFRCYANNAWNNCGEINPSRTFSQYEEFMGGQTTALTGAGIGSLGWAVAAIGANGSVDFNPTTPTPIADRPGVLALTTPASANQGSTLMLANSTGPSMIIRKTNMVRTAVAVGATTGQVLRVGLHSQTTATTQPVSGVWWEADPAANANWRYCYGNGTTATCTNTTVAIAANTWVRLSILVNETGAGTSSVTFAINNANPVTVSSVTVDTTNRVSPALSCYGTDGAAKNCYWDYYQFTGNTSASR